MDNKILVCFTILILVSLPVSIADDSENAVTKLVSSEVIEPGLFGKITYLEMLGLKGNQKQVNPMTTPGCCANAWVIEAAGLSYYCSDGMLTQSQCCLASTPYGDSGYPDNPLDCEANYWKTDCDQLSDKCQDGCCWSDILGECYSATSDSCFTSSFTSWDSGFPEGNQYNNNPCFNQDNSRSVFPECGATCSDFNNDQSSCSGTLCYFCPDSNDCSHNCLGCSGLIFDDDLNFICDSGVIDPCSNGIKDGDELGIDCGGSCPNPDCCANDHYDPNLGESGIDCGY